MTEAPRYARDCGLEALLWGFEEDLFDDRHDVDLDDYARQIRAATGPG